LPNASLAMRLRGQIADARVPDGLGPQPNKAESAAADAFLASS
jgi:hypothetical protein